MEKLPTPLSTDRLALEAIANMHTDGADPTQIAALCIGIAKAQIQVAPMLPLSIQEAMNSGDGTYKP